MRFARISWIGFVLVLMLGGVPALAQNEDRPNILFLFSDDQRADAVGAYGNPYIQTPHIDGLVHQGFNFHRAYAMGGHHGAVCAPSRAMLMSGRSLYHVYDNLDTLATFPELMWEAGYDTFGTGKWHNGREAFARSFSHAENVFFGGMSDHYQVPVNDLTPGGSFTETELKSYSSTLFADAAINFIDEYAQSGRENPFLAYVSFTSPHDPRTPPEPFLSMYPGEAMPLPPNYMPVHPFHNGWMKGRDEQLAAWPRTSEVVKDQLGEYYGMISHMDFEIGRILTSLHSNGLMENTIIIFAADHGLSMGSHGLLGKQNVYEQSMRVPFVIAGPGIPQGDTNAFAYLFDLFPTLLNLAGVEIPERTDGLDLAPVWKGEKLQLRETLFLTYEDKQRSVRDGRWKLIRYPRLHYNQLFDLQSDPYELRNLAYEPNQADRVAAMMGWLAEWQKILDDPDPLTADVKEDMVFDYESIERKPDRHQPQFVIDKYFSKEEE